MPTHLLDPLLDGSVKGFPPGQAPLQLSQVGAQGWDVLRGDLPFPLALVHRARLQNNLQWMQAFAQARGIQMAPHGKTTLSPQLFQRQMAAGAWGITFANVTQAAVGVAAGVRNCLIANQVFQDVDLQGIHRLLEQHSGLRVLFLVDSLSQLALIESWRAASHHVAPFDVLLEIGFDGGRTGCRSHAQALALARALRQSSAVRLVGVECYEGLWATGDTGKDKIFADALMSRVQAIATVCDQNQFFECDEVLLSAGGSAIFDLVAGHLTASLSKPVRGLLRSGCYITHDQGSYQRLVNVVQQRLGCGDGLQAAMEVWAAVQSLPEPGLAILTVGKRDISYDQQMPIPLLVCARGSSTPRAVPASWHISALNDQHAHLQLGAGEASDAPAAQGLQVGDLVGLGISHPCTTFDKWRWMPLVDEHYKVVDAISTCF